MMNDELLNYPVKGSQFPVEDQCDSEVKTSLCAYEKVIKWQQSSAWVKATGSIKSGTFEWC